MADVFEQNLPSKANLTTNDYIRVVGSDNNSYKQLVSDVAKKIIENYTGSSLAGSSQSVKSALDTLNSNKVSLVVSQIISALVGCGTSNRAFEITANQNDGDQYIFAVDETRLRLFKKPSGGSLTELWTGDMTSGASSATIRISSGTVAANTLVKSNGVINVHIAINGMSASAAGTVATLPSDYIPRGTRHLMGYVVVDNARVPMSFTIATNGDISYSYSSTRTATQIEISGTIMF